ncbi:hypothetical protein F8388_009994 [Cannabis sativa]|uniref:Uncharacterized protein n=1 Tax=Cannabis sativa TaxID=3483 RepID=A0A7J6HKA7_CANSA|nr:hypothetical protein F8388_009994 [Cannabis sativa]KAF4395049.1 hypothetical protein G4B88_017919 [Cannabis sativa]
MARRSASPWTKHEATRWKEEPNTNALALSSDNRTEACDLSLQATASAQAMRSWTSLISSASPSSDVALFSCSAASMIAAAASSTASAAEHQDKRASINQGKRCLFLSRVFGFRSCLASCIGGWSIFSLGDSGILKYIQKAWYQIEHMNSLAG